MATVCRVLTHAATTPESAVEHFAAELAFEVDPDDLHRDLVAGTHDGYTVSYATPPRRAR